MNRLHEVLGKINESIKSLLARVEESPPFERMMLAYEGLDSTQQALARGGFRLLCITAAVYLAVSPVWKIYSAKSTIRTFNDAAFQLQVLAARGSEVVSQAPKPPTWHSMPASNASELENSLREYLANIGVSEELYTARADGQDRLELNIEELTLKQALALTFQIDGWYPNVRAETVEINVNANHADRLQMKVAAYIPAALPGGGAGFDDDHDTNFESSAHEANGGDNASGNNNNANHDRFNNSGDKDYFDMDTKQVPPPPPDYNDGAPPPPPPTFDENFDDSPPTYDEGDL